MLLDQFLDGQRHFVLQLFGTEQWIVRNRRAQVRAQLHREAAVNRAHRDARRIVNANEEAAQETHTAEALAQVLGEHWNDGLEGEK